MHAHRTSAPLAIMLILVSLLIVASCGDDDDPATPPAPTNVIGPGGGTVTSAGGAQVTIPAGALAAETTIEVTTYAHPQECPRPTGPCPDYQGGAEFGPHGLSFSAPATVTIPCREELAPGSRFPLFVWDEDASAWAQTDFVATVAADGKTFSAPVTHFSVFGGFGGGEGGLFGAIDEQLCAGGDPATVMADFIAQFKRDIADVGDKGIHDDQCQEVTGIDFDIGVEIEGNWLSDFVREGETADHSLMFVYTAECGSGQSSGGYCDATVVIYYECTAPGLAAAADPSRIDHGASSTVMATLSCGALPFPGQAIQFECFGDGDITTDLATTNPAGQAQTMYNAPDQNGEATVKAYHDACAGEDNAQTVQAAAGITVGSSWSGTLTVQFSHPLPDPPLLEFADILTVPFNFEIVGGVISGTGTGSHNIDITPGGDCSLSSLSAPAYPFAVAGSATDETLDFMVVPDGLMPIHFVLTCGFDPPVDFPYPPYGALEGAIIASHINLSLGRENNATASGSGSEDWGEGLPMHYSYTVQVTNEGR